MPSGRAALYRQEGVGGLGGGGSPPATSPMSGMPGGPFSLFGQMFSKVRRNTTLGARNVALLDVGEGVQLVGASDPEPIRCVVKKINKN
eukprot:1316780-Pyramimonas_sp.AAC.1